MLTNKIFADTVMTYMKPQILYILILVMPACQSKVKTQKNVISGIGTRLDSLPKYLKDINAYYAVYMDSSGIVREFVHGNNSNAAAVNNKTLFEGASLSKTFFAFLYWRLMNQGTISRSDVTLPSCGSADSCQIPPFLLLNHLVRCKKTCVESDQARDTFSYSENGYLLLQAALEKRMGSDLETIARPYLLDFYTLSSSSFIWSNNNTNFVNGFYENNKLHRPIYKLFKPQSNGSLYTCGADLAKFTQILMNSAELDSISASGNSIPGYSQLSWGRGMGIEKNQGKTYCWQWGSNWSFNHIVLINKTDHSAFILLTNSIIGAKRAREATNFLLGTQFQLFDYIKWY